MTQSNHNDLLFQELGSREVVARFDGATVTSEAGGLLLREVEEKFHFIDAFSRCFTDHGDPDLVEHTCEELLKQRIFGFGWWRCDRRCRSQAPVCAPAVGDALVSG
jgi:hypothetical protein